MLHVAPLQRSRTAFNHTLFNMISIYGVYIGALQTKKRRCIPVCNLARATEDVNCALNLLASYVMVTSLFFLIRDGDLFAVKQALHPDLKGHA